MPLLLSSSDSYPSPSPPPPPYPPTSPASTPTPAAGPDPLQSWVATGSLKFTPGEKTRYSSTNFVLLGLLLAQLTGVRPHPNPNPNPNQGVDSSPG